MHCAKCALKKCYIEGKNCTDMDTATVEGVYGNKQLAIMKAAACTEANAYNRLTRLEETVEFCNGMGYKKLGLAFCIGLAEEAKLIECYLSKFFQVSSVCCKICGVAKADFELDQIKPKARETMCNPMIQATILNKSEVEFSITVGLCVGHDALFTQACEMPVFCMVAKDRVLGHNPLGAVYSRYWRKKLGIQPENQV